MTIHSINIDKLREYVDATFEGDDDILFYYDKKEKVKTIPEACENIVNKIGIVYNGSELRGIKINGHKVGYFVYTDELLISFGLNKCYRNKAILTDMWEHIKLEVGDEFQCLLYSYNVRAVDWLRRCGMDVLFDNVTVLRFQNHLN